VQGSALSEARFAPQREVATVALVVALAGSAAAFAALAGVQWAGADVLLYGGVTVLLGGVGLLSPTAGLALLIIAIPFHDALTLGPLAVPYTAAHVLLGAVIIGWLVRIVRTGRAALPKPTPLAIALAFPLVAALLSLPTSMAPEATALESFRLLALWLLALLVAWHASTTVRARRFVALLVAVACCMAAVAALQYRGVEFGSIATQGLFSGDLLVRPAAFFLDPNFLGGYLSVAALAALAIVVRSERWGAALVWLAAATVCGAGMAITASRSAAAGFVVGVIVVVVTAPRKRRTAIVIGGLLVAAIALPLLPGQVVERFTGLLAPQAEGSLATRSLMIESSVEMLGDHWFLGTGLGAFEDAYPPYRRPGALPRILHPHQLPLAMWVEMGLVGLLAEIGLVGGVLIAWRSAAMRGYPGASPVALAAVTALLVQSLFQYYLFFEYLWLFLGLLAASSLHEEHAHA
jgi:O-antigen ligase